MTTSIPTRITIELEPADERRGGWRARTRIDGRAPRRSDQAPAISVFTTEAPDVPWTPAPYAPGPCTCEDGLCDRDHEND
jgi:hypothetical protein